MASLDKITLNGFKSIKELTDFKLNKLNVLIGANGAGKSNLVDFFRMLRAMADGGFQKFITDGGGPDGFFFDGPQKTTHISSLLEFEKYVYRFTLAPTVAGDMVIEDEAVLNSGSTSHSDWQRYGCGKTKPILSSWKGCTSDFSDHLAPQVGIYSAVSSWMVFHLHDTSNIAPIRRDANVRDFRELRPDAGNLAAFLLKMRNDSSKNYQRIRETVHMIAPFFNDFLLDPQKNGQNELVRLEWWQIGSTYPMQPWQLSDGTIRFIALATALLQPKPPSTIVIDEPELGLHPFAIELLAALIHEASDRMQLVVSTQSPGLLDHFEPEDVIVVDREQGASIFRRLDRESLEQWIQDYSVGELVRKNVIEAGPRNE